MNFLEPRRAPVFGMTKYWSLFRSCHKFGFVTIKSDESEVDVTLIRWMLSLSPLERIKFAQKTIRAILKVRRDNRQK
jgi:hypothetical protein